MVKVDPVTVEMTQRGASRSRCGTGLSWNSIAYNAVDGKIYAYASQGSNKYIANMKLDGSAGTTAVTYAVDTNLGTPLSHQLAIAINPLTGDAFAYDGSDGTFFTLNLSNGNLHQVAAAPNPTISIKQLAYSPSGTLYAYDSTANSLLSVDPTTGARTQVASNFSSRFADTNFNQLYGMAFDSMGTMFIAVNNVSIGGEQIWSASSDDAFATPRVIQGANPNAPQDGINQGTPWNANIQAQSGSPIIITFGLQKIVFDTRTNGGAAIKPGFSRFLTPTVLAAAGMSVNAPATFPAPAVRSGYTFDGWFDAANGGTKVGSVGDTYVPAGTTDITFYAQWTKKSSSGNACSKAVGSVQFAPDSAALSKTTKKKLSSYAAAIKASGCTSITLKGFTASVHEATKSSQAARVALSKKRNTAVAKYLNTEFKKLGVTITIKKQALESSQPVASNKTEKGRVKNRRVEIVLRSII